MTLMLESSAFSNAGEIPARHTCEGEDCSPPLRWTGVPEGAMSLVLIVDDPDAPDPDAPKVTWVHWVLFNIPASADHLPENATCEVLPSGTQEGLNDWKQSGYRGPCPPIGRHRYFHKLYALNSRLDALTNPTKAEVEAAMEGKVLAQTQLVGTYQKK